MTEIAEAYFHLRPFTATSARIQELGELATAIATEEARGIYPSDTEIIVRLAPGSLKGWTKVVAGTLFVTYGAVSDYKGFKESVQEIVADGRRFTTAVNERFLQKAHVPETKVLRTERRTKTPGRILRAYRRAEWLEQHKADLSKEDYAREATLIAEQLRLAMEDLTPTEGRSVFDETARKHGLPLAPPDVSRVAIYRRRPAQITMQLQEEREPSAPPPDEYVAHVRL